MTTDTFSNPIWCFHRIFLFYFFLKHNAIKFIHTPIHTIHSIMAETLKKSTVEIRDSRESEDSDCDDLEPGKRSIGSVNEKPIKRRGSSGSTQVFPSSLSSPRSISHSHSHSQSQRHPKHQQHHQQPRHQKKSTMPKMVTRETIELHRQKSAYDEAASEGFLRASENYQASAEEMQKMYYQYIEDAKSMWHMAQQYKKSAEHERRIADELEEQYHD